MKYEKSEFAGLDFFKFIGALLVVAIHIPPLAQINGQASYVFQQIICRIAVPIFFLCTGFFLGAKVTEKSGVRTYLGRILRMYFLWTILYLPVIVDKFWNTKASVTVNIKELVKRFLLVGSYVQLWYLLATLIGVGILYLCKQHFHFGDKRVLAAALICYGIGLMGNSYRQLSYHIPVVAQFMHWYQDIFVSFRNGLFFGFPFVTFGYLIRSRMFIQNQPPCSGTSPSLFHRDFTGLKWQWYGIIGIMAWFFMYMEDALIIHFLGEASHDMYLMTMFASIFLFLCFAMWPIDGKWVPAGKFLRQMSTDIFLVHLLVNFLLKKMITAAGMEPLGKLPRYFAVVGISILISLIWHRPKEKTTYMGAISRKRKPTGGNDNES